MLPRMKFARTAVLRIRGQTHAGTDLPVDVFGGAVSIAISSDPDPICIYADKAAAIALMMLNGMFRAGPAFSSDLLELEVAKIRAERRRPGNPAYLVLRHTGEVETRVPTAQADVDDFVVCFDAVDKKAVRALSQQYLTAAVAALALESQNVTGFETVTDAVVLFQSDGKPVFSYTGSGSADVTVSSPFAVDAPIRIGLWLRHLVSTERLRLVAKLLSHAIGHSSDNLKAFWSSWTALEVFVNRSFPAYKAQLLADAPTGATGEENLFRRCIREELGPGKGRRGVKIKFRSIAALLAPADAERDSTEFEALADLRNVVHEDALEVTKQDIARIHLLLRKYLRLHLAAVPPS
jgi:hypothetical protein